MTGGFKAMITSDLRIKWAAKKMITNSRLILLWAFCASGFFLSLPLHAESITFGVITSDKPSTMYRKFQPILDYPEAHMARGGGKSGIQKTSLITGTQIKY